MNNELEAYKKAQQQAWEESIRRFREARGLAPETEEKKAREDAATDRWYAKREAKRQAAEARREQQARIEAANGDWRQEPATAAQIAYLRRLGVDVSDEQTRELTKGLASRIIDAAKSGEGVGQFGMFMRDGSN